MSITKEQIQKWLDMTDYHNAQCTSMQACCDMAASEGVKAIRALVAALAEARGNA